MLSLKIIFEYLKILDDFIDTLSRIAEKVLESVLLLFFVVKKLMG